MRPCRYALYPPSTPAPSPPRRRPRQLHPHHPPPSTVTTRGNVAAAPHTHPRIPPMRCRPDDGVVAARRRRGFHCATNDVCAVHARSLLPPLPSPGGQRPCCSHRFRLLGWHGRERWQGVPRRARVGRVAGHNPTDPSAGGGGRFPHPCQAGRPLRPCDLVCISLCPAPLPAMVSPGGVWWGWCARRRQWRAASLPESPREALIHPVYVSDKARLVNGDFSIDVSIPPTGPFSGSGAMHIRD